MRNIPHSELYMPTAECQFIATLMGEVLDGNSSNPNGDCALVISLIQQRAALLDRVFTSTMGVSEELIELREAYHEVQRLVMHSQGILGKEVEKEEISLGLASLFLHISGDSRK